MFWIYFDATRKYLRNDNGSRMKFKTETEANAVLAKFPATYRAKLVKVSRGK